MAGLFDEEASVVHLKYNSKQMASCVSDQDRGLQVFIAACMQRFVPVSSTAETNVVNLCLCQCGIAAVLCYVWAFDQTHKVDEPFCLELRRKVRTGLRCCVDVLAQHSPSLRLTGLSVLPPTRQPSLTGSC